MTRPLKRDDLFEQRSPPPGGLAVLRARIDRRARSRLVRRVVPVAAAFAAAAVILFFILSRQAPPDFVSRARLHQETGEIALGLVATPREAVDLSAQVRSTTAVARVPTSRNDVAFYWVASTEENSANSKE